MNREKKLGIVLKVMGVMLFLLVFQLALYTIQQSRYHFEAGADNNLGCVELSKECEAFFEGVLGIRVLQVRGCAFEYKEVVECGQLTHKPDYIPHQWIILDFGLFRIPYESTHLAPINPEWYHNFENLQISEGHYIGHREVVKDPENLVFKDWER